jgi:hypothetical protein
MTERMRQMCEERVGCIEEGVIPNRVYSSIEHDA